MRKQVRRAVLVGTTALALGAIGTGVALAATDGSATTQRGGTEQGIGIGAVGHGAVTLDTKSGYLTFTVQDGKVATVDATSMTVTGGDGYTADYHFGTNTKVQENGQIVPTSAIRAGDGLLVTAARTKTPGLYAASFIVDRGTAKQKGDELAHVGHGTLTLIAKRGGGYASTDVQSGTVTAVSSSALTVRGQDGYTATYAVPASVKVLKGDQRTGISSVSTGDQVFLWATPGQHGDTVIEIAD